MARVLDGAGNTVGVGVLLEGGRFVTCAHVVNLALGRGEGVLSEPSGVVRVEFPGRGSADGVVRRWLPSPSEDVARLELSAVPVGVEPAVLAARSPLPGRVVRVFGYPGKPSRPQGAWVEAVVRGRVDGGLVQLDSRSALQVQRGYSGSPVWDDASGRVVGVVALAGVSTLDSYAVPVEVLAELTAEWRSTDPVVLHLPGLRCGSGLPLPRFEEDVRADLVVVAGDLTEHGLRSEFAEAFGVLAEVAERLGLARDRVAVVPGTRDVNLKACAAYFLAAEAEEREPVPPYWPKWQAYKEAFDRFYEGFEVEFTRDAPWTLYEHPELGVAVAGVNSTVGVSHLSAGVDVAQPPAQRVEECRARGWLVLGVAHGLEADRSCDAWFRDVPDTAVVTVRRGATQRDEVSREPGGFFERVVEATVVARPEATVTPAEGYLRITERLPGGGVDSWAVGTVEGEVTAAAVDRFAAEVHTRFASGDPSARSELVYSGPPASGELVEQARRRGVRLRSWIDYLGLIDLRRYEQSLRERLAADTIYPAELYVRQRYQYGNHAGTDALGQVLDWLGSSTAQFVMVLGDFGRGKSFLLRQVARELNGPTPLLVDMRRLEKAPSLDQLLVQVLVDQGVDVVDVTKLRYMISSGRVVLLFDGFDELELRVGYDNAADYLTTLLDVVSGEAKVVLTSRTQHFKSTRQVLTALGRDVASLSASKLMDLEDFTDGQILEFLHRHYGGDAVRARARVELLHEVHDLLGLSGNPRMLSFIADLDEDQLREVQRREGSISAAELYRELVDYWLLRESERQEHPRGLPSFDRDERLRVCTELAMQLWDTTEETIQEKDLGDAVQVLSRLSEREYSLEQAVHAVGSGTLLVRKDDGFGFVHQSVMEWLVANEAAAVLREGGDIRDIVKRSLSLLMVDFFCDLTGHDQARTWAANLVSDQSADIQKRHNALKVLRRLRGAGPLDLRGLDLRGLIFENDDLTDAALTGSNWKGALLINVRGFEAHPELTDAAVLGRSQPEIVLASSPATYGVVYQEDGTLLTVLEDMSGQIWIPSGVCAATLHQVAEAVVQRSEPTTARSPDGSRTATILPNGATEVRGADGTLLMTLATRGKNWLTAFPSGAYRCSEESSAFPRWQIEHWNLYLREIARYYPHIRRLTDTDPIDPPPTP
ncbi:MULTISPECIES: trypsin-like peptidase domain-containing protein [Actinosynnema]|uniref:trypsin-like peptidase domain-containing protein n=1 Tax=Actinosynnema TaxID=40566 RepID=UPI0020A43F9E|nr:trypsin-like peptidase domain-containing protein [Actinosynnema pretiosum]